MARYLRSFVGMVQHSSNHVYTPEEYCIYFTRPNGVLCFGGIDSLVGFIAKKYGNDFKKHLRYTPPGETEAIVFGIGTCYNRFHELSLEDKTQLKEAIRSIKEKTN